ncbi:hypothetical protein EW026_g4733 [Hermanssonia centrifuga]|uniref:Protein kinase domain-containing protein n=1 Tax=Hermanssonia centrifuga TaxID=98765 RepID=A0A4S4KH99_9APHY|nr:hypothetical protein EW026_g4733 [Hermanssonia centrifuga]
MPRATQTRQVPLPPVQVEEHCPRPPPRPGEDADFVREGTPLVMSLSCLLTVEHTNATVHPYVKQDIACAKSVPYHVWTGAILKLDKNKLKKWVSHIKRREWRNDPIIQEALIQFCGASKETSRYEPYEQIINRILELAKDQLSGLDSYPIEDIKITRNDPKYIERIPEQGVLGALRKPDLLFVRGAAVERVLSSTNARFRWSDILTFAELKAESGLLPVLNGWRVQQGLSEIDPDTLKPRAETRKGRSRAKASSSKPDPTGTTRALRGAVSVAPDGGSHVLASAPKHRAGAALHATVQEHCSTTGLKRARQHDDSESLHIAKKSSTESGAAKSDMVTLDATVQAGGYALEVASCTYGTRLFCLGTVMEDDKLSLWYYDAVGIVRTQETISIIHDFETFAAVQVGFACCEPSQWGALPPIIKPPPSAAYPESFPPQSLRGYMFGASIRSTAWWAAEPFLYAIKTKSKTLRKPLIAKFSYQVTTRMPEQEFVEIAREAGAGHLPEVHMWEDLWKMSDGVRAAFHEKSDEYEDRVLRALVYTQYFPLKELFSKSCDLIPEMVDQMLDCLHDLRYKANILHRDISCHNVMYEMHGEKVNFILIDFDNATRVDARGAPRPSTKSKHRTGTLPFMAWELIKDMANRELKGYRPRIVHVLRHDFESLFYLSLWCAITIPAMKDQMMKKGDLPLTYPNKKMLCTTMGETDNIDFPLECENLRPWFRRWNALLATAAMQLEQHKLNVFHADDYIDPLFDEETVDGTLSRDSIKRALSGKVRRMRLVDAEPEEPLDLEIGMALHNGERPSTDVEFGPLGEAEENGDPDEIQEPTRLDGRGKDDVPGNDIDDLPQRRIVPRRSDVKGRAKKEPKAKKVASTRKVVEAKKVIENKRPTARRVADIKKLEVMTKTTAPIKPPRRAGPSEHATATRGMTTRSMAKKAMPT